MLGTVTSPLVAFLLVLFSHWVFSNREVLTHPRYAASLATGACTSHIVSEGSSAPETTCLRKPLQTSLFKFVSLVKLSYEPYCHMMPVFIPVIDPSSTSIKAWFVLNYQRSPDLFRQELQKSCRIRMVDLEYVFRVVQLLRQVFARM
jgi:hypothetical protein